MSEWQPIETAPKMMRVDIWVKAKRRDESTRMCNMMMLEDGSWFGPRSLYRTDRVTHWMPLPNPPQDDK